MLVAVKEFENMTLNFNMKISSGTKSDIKVEIYSTAYREKIMEFKNSKKTITNTQLADAIADLVAHKLKEWSLKP